MKSTDRAVSVSVLRLAKDANGNSPFMVQLAHHERELLPSLI